MQGSSTRSRIRQGDAAPANAAGGILMVDQGPPADFMRKGL